MNKRLSFKEYRAIDLLIYTAIVIIFEIISQKAVSWLNVSISFSLFFALSLLVIMRWNFYAIIPVLGSQITYSIMLGSSLKNYLVYIIGSIFIFIVTLFFVKGKEKMKNPWIIVLYIFSGYFAVEIGRSFIAIFFGSSFFKTLVGFLGTDIINIFIAFLIIFIARRQDGVFEDQKSFLIRKEKEDQKIMECQETKEGGEDD